MLRRATALSVTIASLAFGLAVAIAMAGERGASPQFRERRRAAELGEELGPGLHIAGSGSNLVGARALVRGFLAERPDLRVMVHDSIGSTGGVRAVADGVTQLGLASRPLNEREAPLGLVQIAYARTPIVFIGHPEITDQDLSSGAIAAVFSGSRDRFSDGQPIVVMMRERGDSGQAAVAEALPDVGRAIESALESERFRVVYHDGDLVRAVLGTPGGFGISDLSRALVDAPHARRFRIDGVEASVANLEAGRYPFAKDLSFVLARPVSPETLAFLRFVASDTGRAILVESACTPLLDREQVDALVATPTRGAP